jgi:hypothetical protein
MVKDHGKDVLTGDKAKSYLADYCARQFRKEAAIFRQILEAASADYVTDIESSSFRLNLS